ncbi:DUF3316 domain-containing protein [Vibrio variabilis]|uniref:DUF3316 domain-containing protein n=1 Tax=Vibrio variabilis TaxID=990271 RepID=UPI000DDB67CE|nr:DUF3316 domain-containing protein [Vibrio variabilis]
MKKLLPLAAIIAMAPTLALATADNLYGSGGVHTEYFETKAEAMAEVNRIVDELSSKPSHELAFVLRTPSKSLDRNSIEIYDKDVSYKTKLDESGSTMYQGTVNVEYRYSRYN